MPVTEIAISEVAAFRRFARLSCRPHLLPHGHATKPLAANKAKPRQVSGRPGHATAAFTQGVYGRVIPGMEQDALDNSGANVETWESASKMAAGMVHGPFLLARVELLCGCFEMAERVGFEPTEPRGSTVFKTAAFDHSATSPMARKDTGRRGGLTR